MSCDVYAVLVKDNRRTVRACEAPKLRVPFLRAIDNFRKISNPVRDVLFLASIGGVFSRGN